MFSILAVTAAAAWSPLRAQTDTGAQTVVLDQRAAPAQGAVDRPTYGPGAANYRLAARWAPYKIEELIYSTQVQPRWIEGGERFWYEWETSDGTFYYIVDPVRGTKRQLFDNDRIAAELTRITRDPWDGRHLPIRNIRFIDENTLQFDVQSSQDEEVEEQEIEDQTERDVTMKAAPRRRRPRKKMFHFEYDVDTQTLRELEDWEAPDDHPSWASVSPDGQTVIFARHHNLYMMSGEDYQRILDARRGKDGDEAEAAEDSVEVTEIQLTEDGVEHYSYAVGDRGDTDKEREKNKDKRKRAAISWSKDSKRFALVRSDRRKVGDLWVIHSVGNDRPELETYKYDMPGEENVTQQELLIYDLEARKMVKVQVDAWKDQELDIANDRQFRYPDSQEPRRSLWLSDNSDELYFLRLSRDRKRADLAVADATTGEVRVIIEERLNTYLETRPPELLPNGDVLWWSERDGWAHLYRFANDGTLKNRLTQGPFSVRDIEGVDAENGVVYFVAAGREEGEDPYYLHLYRVNLDGSGLQLLNPGDFDHRIDLSESNRYFVDNYSRVNTVPAAVLRDRSGREVLELETADFSRLNEAGWQMPEPFKVKAADGVTDLYGVMYKPFDFDPNRKYPIIEYVYPGPQTESVSKSFSTNRYETGLAQFGFIVITVGNRGGNPSRSKWYHNYGYGNLRDYGLADKKAAVEQLADRYDFIDIERVGIYGHSGGGFMSTAAMLVYPDFFDVAVSSSGNHTNDVYNRWWSETHHGVKEVVDDSGKVHFEYDIDKNPDLAKNLKGHLLLTTGDIDNNVHPANTLRMVEALIRANKRFDFFIFPGQRHGYGNMSDYWFWLRAEYFVKHLLGDTSHWNADIIPLQVEKEKTTT
ncbi:MAG TPA: DPP IV N-terminal domain-containing protein [Longimicrobiales bacterium]